MGKNLDGQIADTPIVRIDAEAVAMPSVLSSVQSKQCLVTQERHTGRSPASAPSLSSV